MVDMMNGGRTRLTGWLWAAAVVAGASALVTPAHGEADPVVVEVGGDPLRVSTLARHASRIPLFQLRDYGDTNGANRESAIRQALVQELTRTELLVRAARDAKLDQRSEVRERIQGVLRSALLSEVRQSVAGASAISDADVKKFYEQNKDRYTPQKRLKLWQIVVGSKREGDALLNVITSSAEFKKSPVAVWDKLAREHSLDKATAMRKGNLGFVNADGTTKHKDQQVSPILYEAAARVRDGEVVPNPVKLGNYWIILMRRGSVDTPHRTLASEAPTIRGMLAKKRVQEAARKLVEQLREANLKEIHPAHVDHVILDEFGGLRTRQRPGAVLHRAHKARAVPRPAGRPLR